MNFPKLQQLTEAIQPAKTVKKVATYRKEAVTNQLMKKLEKHAPDFDVTVTYGKPFDDRNEGMMQTIRVEGERANIKAFVKKTGLVMNDSSLHEGKDEAEEGMDEAPAVDKAAVLAFLKDCDPECRADVHKKLTKMVEADEAAAEK